MNTSKYRCMPWKAIQLCIAPNWCHWSVGLIVGKTLSHYWFLLHLFLSTPWPDTPLWRPATLGHENNPWTVTSEARLWLASFFLGSHSAEYYAISLHSWAQLFVAVRSWRRKCECSRLLFGPKPAVLAYYYGFTLLTTRCSLLLRVEISECCVLLFLLLILSSLTGTLSGPTKAFPDVADFVLQGC